MGLGRTWLAGLRGRGIKAAVRRSASTHAVFPSSFAAPRVGTAGWSIPSAVTERFSGQGSQLERYARQFRTVEINSSFYRPHREATYERWAASVPDEFTFAVKAPRQVTHDRRLVGTTQLLASFRDGIARLGEKLGPVLIQLPPSLAFDDAVAGRFFETWRELFDGLTVCEPRHPSWYSNPATSRLAEARVARVIADPQIDCEPSQGAEFGECAYYRLHGSPVMYASSYGPSRLDELARRLIKSTELLPTWCIFDNTKYGAATGNALALKAHLEDPDFGGA